MTQYFALCMWEKESIIAIHRRQQFPTLGFTVQVENSAKPRSWLRRWTLWLGFYYFQWTPVIDYICTMFLNLSYSDNKFWHKCNLIFCTVWIFIGLRNGGQLLRKRQPPSHNYFGIENGISWNIILFPYILTFLACSSSSSHNALSL